MKRQTYPEADHDIVSRGVSSGHSVPQHGIDCVRRVRPHALHDVEGVL